MRTTRLTLYNMLFLFFSFFFFQHVTYNKYWSHLYLDGVLMILPLLVLLVTVSSLVISAGTNCWDTGWGSTTNCWDICWDSGTDCSDFDWCSAKLFRDCSWIMSSLVWGGTVSLSFAKDELVSSKSKLNVSFDFSMLSISTDYCGSISILYDLLEMSNSMIIPLWDQDLSWCVWIDCPWFKGGRFFAFYYMIIRVVGRQTVELFLGFYSLMTVLMMNVFCHGIILSAKIAK